MTTTEDWRDVPTYWNGEPTPCRRVVVRVGTCAKPTLWFSGLEGTERQAVEVSYGGAIFFLDDDDDQAGKGTPEVSDKMRAIYAADPGIEERAARPREKGEGWLKVTLGRGAPFGEYAGFRSLPTDSVVVREVD